MGRPDRHRTPGVAGEDLETWPDEKGVEELALRFGARIDLAFGGNGTRHLASPGT